MLRPRQRRSIRLFDWLALVLASGISTSAGAEPPRVSPLVPPDHWSVRAVERLDELGLFDDFLSAQGAVPLTMVERALAIAAERGGTFAPLAASYGARLAEEFRRHDGPAHLGLMQAALSGSVEARESALPAHPPSRQPVLEARGSDHQQGGGGQFSGAWTRHFAAYLRANLERGRLTFPAWELVAGVDPVGLSVGRAAVAYGFSRAGGVVFSGRVPVERVELHSSTPLWIAGRVPMAFHVFVSQFREDRHPNAPFLVGTGLRAKPHPRLTLSAQRGVMVGSGRSGRSLSPHQVIVSVLGLGNGGENNVLSAAFRYRAPTEHWLPLTLYGEWGMDDRGGAHYEAPALLGGVRVPAVPGARELQVGAEFAYMGVLCCRHHEPDTGWYAHHNHVGGWTSGSTPLGHPLAGDGRELRAYGDAALFDARMRLGLDAFFRSRDDVNLYAPVVMGRSLGLEATAAWRFHAHGEVAIDGEFERGTDWSLASGAARASFFF